MELRPYYDRPTGQIKNYLSLIEQKIASNFPHWGRGSQGVWPKGDYGKGILRADQFSILGTYGQWLIPSSGSTGSPSSATVDSWYASLLDTNGADIVNQSSYSLYQSGSACDLWTVEFSGQREGCFDFNDQDISLVKKGHSHGSVIVDPWFPRELILQYCVSSSLGVLPSSLKVSSLHAFDTLEPEIAASASRLICFFKYEKEALESLLLDCFETAEGPEEDEGSAAGFQATKCDAEVPLQAGGNDGCLEDSGPIVDQCTPRVPTVLGHMRALFSSFRRMLLGRELWPHSSLTRRNYRDGCPGDPAKAIGSELAGASLQAQEEKVSGFLFVFIHCAVEKERCSFK